MNSRVVVIEPTTKDLSAAEPFGKLVYLFGEHDTRPSIWETGDFLQAVQEKLEKINFSEEDYLLCVGSVVPLMSVMAMLSNLYPHFRVLFWHAQVREYVPRSFAHGDYYDTAGN